MKKGFIIIFIIISVFLSSCKKGEEGLEYEKIDAYHLVSDDSISSYMVLSTVPVAKSDELYYSLTIYADFLKGNSRYYNYYQVDYETNDENIHQYYHNFVFGVDDDRRKYAQMFLPFQKLNEITKFDVLFDYEYVLEEEKINGNLKYHEDILKLSQKEIEDASEEFNDFKVDLKTINVKENYDSIKMEFSFENIKNGHLDFQSWIELKSGELLPFYGVYHYQTERGNYRNLSYIDIEKSFTIENVYVKINHYYENECETYIYKMKY